MDEQHLRICKVIMQIVKRGIKLERQIDGLDDAPQNPLQCVQHLWEEFKSSIPVTAQQYSCETGRKTEHILASLEKDRECAMQAMAEGKLNQIMEDEMTCEEEIYDLRTLDN